MSVAASLLILFFVAGVVIASVTAFLGGGPHGPTVLTTFSLIFAARSTLCWAAG